LQIEKLENFKNILEVMQGPHNIT